MLKMRKQQENADPNMTPMMNLMVVLIPMLLVSVEFARISVIDAKKSEDGSTTERKQTRRPEDTTDLQMVALVTDTTVTIAAQGGFLPTMRYREFHHFRLDDHKTVSVVEFDNRKKSYLTPPPQGIQREEVRLYLAEEETDSLVIGYHTREGRVLLDRNGLPKTTLHLGDTAWVAGDGLQALTITAATDFEPAPIRVEQALAACASAIRVRFEGARDRDEITLSSEGGVRYDKLIVLMDELREKSFGVAMARMRT